GVISGLKEMWEGASGLIHGEEGAGWDLGMGAVDTGLSLVEHTPLLDAVGGGVGVMQGLYEMTQSEQDGKITDQKGFEGGLGDSMLGGTHMLLGMAEDAVRGALVLDGAAEVGSGGLATPVAAPAAAGLVAAEGALDAIDLGLGATELVGDVVAPYFGFD